MSDIEFFIHEKIVNAYYVNPKRYTVVKGGRGSSKSIGIHAIAIIEMIKNPKYRVLFIRGFQNKISESSLQILKDIISMMKVEDYFQITENTLTCKNGSQTLFYGAKAYQSFKSIQGIDLCLVDEATEVSQAAWDVLTPSIRANNSRFLISFNPDFEHTPVYKKFITNKHPDAVVVELNYPDNPFFPEVLRQEMEYDKANNIAKYLHIWMGQLIQKIDSALWDEPMIKYISDIELGELTLLDYDNLERIVVAIDPSITANQSSDACGLVVVGKYRNKNKYIVLDDQTAILSPNAWADRALTLFDKYKADRIVAEINQGGDMVKTIIHTKRPGVPFTAVHASKAKIARAEPIAALYEQDMVVHARKFVNLEFEMVTFSGKSTDKSPNSLDALVWALTELSQIKSIAPKNMVKASSLINF